MENTERRSRIKKVLLIAVLLILLVYIIGSTYARYITVGDAEGKIQVAKWAVAIKADDGTVLNSTTQDITFTVQSNAHVVPGKIAPNVTAVAEVELDLTGTEVSVDFDAVIDQSAISTVFGTSASDVALAVEVDGTEYTSGTSQTIALQNNAAFTSSNGKKTVTLTLTWTNNESHNANDTSLGEAAPTLTIPVTLTAKQHINT